MNQHNRLTGTVIFVIEIDGRGVFLVDSTVMNPMMNVPLVAATKVAAVSIPD
jgi:hypothetical protein